MGVIDPLAPTPDPDPATARLQRRQILTRARIRTERAEEMLRLAHEARHQAIIECHGDRKLGFLSYTEIAKALGISKNRVTQIVPPAKDRT